LRENVRRTVVELALQHLEGCGLLRARCREELVLDKGGFDRVQLALERDDVVVLRRAERVRC